MLLSVISEELYRSIFICRTFLNRAVRSNNILTAFAGRMPFAEKLKPVQILGLTAGVLSVLYCGDYSGADEACLTLGREAKAHGLKPAAAPRALGIVAPYTGREIETKRYCSRFVLPVED